MKQKLINQQTACFHCGEYCGKEPIVSAQKFFCCEGCKSVFDILNQGGLCDYYVISKNPGTRKPESRNGKFTFLDDGKIKHSLIIYTDETQTHVSFYLPQMHCSSCLWLLENLRKIDENITSSRVNFNTKDINIIFNHQNISLREVAELLTGIGYEPYISLNDIKHYNPGKNNSKIYKLGIAGFCFANIMLLSFPEYLGMDANDKSLINVFRYLNLLLILPVIFYCASEFYSSAWKNIKHNFLNIDAPIVLALWITFGRSIYEIISGSGSGYFDSMAGIVFFMLIGRVLQDSTYRHLNFDRDYTSYFPVAVTRIQGTAKETVLLPEIVVNDTIVIHNQELIPADGILTSGTAFVDYSFVTGESVPVNKEMGEIIYAGGRQTGTTFEMLVTKPVAQSYLTGLWNRDEPEEKSAESQRSFVDLISRYFTWMVLTISCITALYWWINDPSKIWNSATAVMIIACPCALLLSNTFTNGNILRILSRNKFYLRNAQTIEDIAKANHIAFDKTGTLTTGTFNNIEYVGQRISLKEQDKIALLASQSSHPLGKALASHLSSIPGPAISGFKEIPGSGIQGIIGGNLILIGSKEFVMEQEQTADETSVYVSIDNKVAGRFVFKNEYRHNIHSLIGALQSSYSLSVISGDGGGEKQVLQHLMGAKAEIIFNQNPDDKLEYIKHLKQKGNKVIMMGDGLNDAGALKEANVGIAVSDNCNNFTPASDAILEAGNLPLFSKFITLCKFNKKVVIGSFIISLIYNLVGIYFAVQGNLSPMIAAILMPSSSLCILLITFGTGNLAAWIMGLK